MYSYLCWIIFLSVESRTEDEEGCQLGIVCRQGSDKGFFLSILKNHSPIPLFTLLGVANCHSESEKAKALHSHCQLFCIYILPSPTILRTWKRHCQSARRKRKPFRRPWRRRRRSWRPSLGISRSNILAKSNIFEQISNPMFSKYWLRCSHILSIKSNIFTK